MSDSDSDSDGFSYTLRHTGTVVLGVIGALAALVLAGVSWSAGLSFVAALATFAGLAVVLLVRPSVRVGTQGVRVDNPFRRHHVPWSAFEDVASRWNLVVYAGNTDIKAWALASRVTRPRSAGIFGFPGVRNRLTRDLEQEADTPRISGLPARVRGTAGGAAGFIEQAYAEWQEGIASGEFRTEADQTSVLARWDLVDGLLVAIPGLVWLGAALLG